MSELAQIVETLFPVPAMRLVFVAGAVLGIVGAVEWLVQRQSGSIFGIAVKVIEERYEGRLRDPQGIDLEAHIHDVARVRWLSPHRVLLLPLRQAVAVHASSVTSHDASATRVRGSWMFVGDLAIGGDAEGVTFRCRVLLRLVPLLGFASFVVMPYLAEPWGMGFPTPWRSPGLLSLFPIALFGGAMAWTVVRARTAVISAFHAVTAAFVAARDP